MGTKAESVLKGLILRIELLEPANVRWSSDDWRVVEDVRKTSRILDHTSAIFRRRRCVQRKPWSSAFIGAIAVIWQYTGLPPDEMAGRMTARFQRSLTTTVNDIEHIEATSYTTISVTTVFFQPNVDIRMANRRSRRSRKPSYAARRDIAADPQLQRLGRSHYSARTVRARPNRTGTRRYRSQHLAHDACHDTRCGEPTPVWRQIAPTALQARDLSRQNVANALAAQNLLTPVGTQKMGNFEYAINLNNAPSAIAGLGDLPIKRRKRISCTLKAIVPCSWYRL